LESLPSSILFIYLFESINKAHKTIEAADTHNVVMSTSHSTVAVDKRYFYREWFYFIIRWNRM